MVNVSGTFLLLSSSENKRPDYINKIFKKPVADISQYSLNMTFVYSIKMSFEKI